MFLIICQLYWISYILFPIDLILAIVVILKLSKDYQEQKKRSRTGVFLNVAFYELFICLLYYVCWCDFWTIELNQIFSIVLLIIGIIIVLIGVIPYVISLKEFKSFKRSVGLDANELITTGIYSRSRNPQLVSWGVAQFGFALMGHSVFAIIMCIIWIIINHPYLLMEEKHLENAFGEKYREYSKNTPRYFKILKKKIK